MLAHELADLLLKGHNYPVVIPSSNKPDEVELIENIFILQETSSPFDWIILLENKSPLTSTGLINLED